MLIILINYLNFLLSEKRAINPLKIRVYGSFLKSVISVKHNQQSGMPSAEQLTKPLEIRLFNTYSITNMKEEFI